MTVEGNDDQGGGDTEPPPGMRPAISVPREWPLEWVVAGACLVALVLMSLPPTAGLWVGGGLVAVSTLVGLVAGVGYHAALFRSGESLPRGWWWSASRAYGQLGAERWARVAPWFVAGVLSFVATLLGAAVFVSSAVRI